MPPKPPPTQRELWLGTGRLFLLFALALVGFGAYKYYEFDQAEKSGTPLLEWTLHASLYDWGGKLAILGFYLVAALVMIGASILGYVQYYHLPPDPPKDQGPPT
jgi:hypothetical protein